MRLFEARKKKALSQEQVASSIGVSQGTYSGWEREERYPDGLSLMKLSETLGVSTDYLLGLTEGMDDLPEKQKSGDPALKEDSLAADISRIVSLFSKLPSERRQALLATLAALEKALSAPGSPPESG